MGTGYWVPSSNPTITAGSGKKEVPVWNLLPFPSRLSPLLLPFPSLPIVSPSCPGGPPQIHLDGLGEHCELLQQVWAEPGRQTVSGLQIMLQ